MKLTELFEQAGAISIEMFGAADTCGLLTADQNLRVESARVTSVSTKIQHGDIFVCIEGLRRDGNDFVAEAVERGASVVVSANPLKAATALRALGKPCALIGVENARKSLSRLCDAANGYPSRRMRFVAVTGTNGKTSVTVMLKSIFEAAMHKCGLVGTIACWSGAERLNYDSTDPLANMTTPDPEQLYKLLSKMADDGVEYVFMEASSHALALEKLAPIQFDAAIFTNLSAEHLDFHGDLENYLEAKLRLFEHTPLAILNADDVSYRKVFTHLKGKCRVISCSCNGAAADYRAQSVRLKGMRGFEYQLVSLKSILRLSGRLAGNFAVINSLQACAAAFELGVPTSAIVDGIASLEVICGRMEEIRTDMETDFSVFIDYAHTPHALECLLMSARPLVSQGARLVLLFGCGGDRDRAKRAPMGRIASLLADKIIVTSDNSRTENPEAIINDVMSGVLATADCVVIPGREDAIVYAVRTAMSGDVILLAGKGHESYELDASGRRPFDERKIVKEAVMKYFKAD